MAKDSKTHTMIFYVKAARDYIKTTPKSWAHANPVHFPQDRFPTVDQIEKYLIDNYNFSIKRTATTVVIYNFDLDVPASNGIAFLQ